jgi:hypothetical protein
MTCRTRINAALIDPERPRFREFVQRSLADPRASGDVPGRELPAFDCLSPTRELNSRAPHLEPAPRHRSAPVFFDKGML